jgi:DHA1 family bicyclomycin/chloramphenicol resistance-like MFS transporter
MARYIIHAKIRTCKHCLHFALLMTLNTDPLAEPSIKAPKGFAALIAALTAIGPFSITMYLPAFPDIGNSLGATPIEVQQTLPAYLLPFAFMMLWHGSISDSLGRKRVILAGMFLYTVAALLCLFAPNVLVLSIGRVLQGIAAGAGMSVGRATVMDLLKGAAAQKLMAHISMFFSLAPALAPMLGSALATHFGWRSVFVFLSLLGAVLFFTVWRILPETLPVQKRQPFAFKPLVLAYKDALLLPEFSYLCLALALLINGHMIYVLSAPNFLHAIADTSFTSFAQLFIAVSIGMLSGSYASSRAAGKLTPNKTVRLGFLVMLIGCLINLLIGFFAPPGLPQNILAIPVYSFGMAMIWPSLQILALEKIPTRRGLASSLQSAYQVGMNALTAAVIAPFVWHSAKTMALTATAYLFMAAIAIMLGRHYQNASSARAL